MIITAEIYVLSSEEGGRIKPFYVGYYANLLLDNGISTDCQVEADKSASEMFEGGNKYVLRLKSKHPENFTDKDLQTNFIIREGKRTIAVGKILSYS